MVDEPLFCAVTMPPLEMVRTNELSDCQFVHVDVTFCVLPFEYVPLAVVCDVSPLALIDPELFDNATDCSVGAVGVGVGVGLVVGVGLGALGDLLPHAKRHRLRTSVITSRIVSHLSKRARGRVGMHSMCTLACPHGKSDFLRPLSICSSDLRATPIGRVMSRGELRRQPAYLAVHVRTGLRSSRLFYGRADAAQRARVYPRRVAVLRMYASGRARYRDSGSGQFITKRTAERSDPRTVEKERVPAK